MPREDMSDYESSSKAEAVEAIAKGHSDIENLRELLIWTTSTTTSAMVEEYFAHHYDDTALLSNLLAIASEGEDAGDAPWAAANTIAQFPARLLSEHRAALEMLSLHPWSYLSSPAKAALAKIAQDAT